MIGTLIAKSKIQSAFDSISQRDIGAFLAGWAEDATWIYPGDLSVSGMVKGKKAIEDWFLKFMEQFPQISFTIKHICVQNIFDMTGTNHIAIEWDINYTNRDGKEFNNSGVTTINLKNGKAVSGRDYYFDINKLRKAWGEG